MIDKAKRAFINIFLAGLLVTLPLAISVIIIKFLFTSIDQILSPLLTHMLIFMGAGIEPGYRVPGLGFFATIVLVFSVGLFTRNYLGRKLLRLGDSILVQIPIFRGIYSGAKQVISTFSASSSMAFKKVALIEYPRRGIYTIAFITNVNKSEIGRRTGREMTNVFVPTTPNPTSGFFLALPKEDVMELDMSVEDGFKIVISGGLIIPEDGGERGEEQWGKEPFKPL